MVTSVLSHSASITAPMPAPQARRHFDIDHMKCLLTIAMVYGHVWMLLGNTFSGTWYTVFGFVARSGVFSGFLFCFGYAVWVSYLQRAILPWKRMLRAAWKCYVAYVICGCAHQISVLGHKPDLRMLFRVSAIQEIPGMTEYLLAFAIMIAVAAGLPQVIRFFTQTRLHFLGAALVCLVLTHFKADQSRISMVGLVVDQKGSDCFPVLPYLPLFLFGAFVARHKLKFNWSHAAVAFAGLGLFVVLAFWWPWSHLAPWRFPPNATWILGSACIVYLWFGLGKLACKLPMRLQRYSNAVGQNVLFYLTLSNLGIFACIMAGTRNTLDPGCVIFVTAAVLSAIFFLQCIVVDYAHVGQMMAEQPTIRMKKR